ncbi:MAG: alpha-N-arabinofuranosidase [Clostridiales bacterium]|jgi:alpha-N-arabinofuranosidase|nr:alpha-N-arabinofuranosidase [Clostridiales bacterium]
MSKLVVNAYQRQSKIDRNIYGHFSEHLGRCIYNGIYVGQGSPIPNTNGIRNDVAQALRRIRVPVLRWPGGCFADEYHWKDGIGPVEKRKKMVNTHWGGVVEDNSFGTHEFLELCRQLDCEPYVNGNLGSGSVQEMQEWVEYMTFDGDSPMARLRSENGASKPWRLKYFAMGNENWGCGGNMTAEHYADEYRRYQTYVRNYGDNKIYKIACGANVADYHWTEVLMRDAGRFIDGLTLHHYSFSGTTFARKGSATDFAVDEWYSLLRKALYMDELIQIHKGIMQRYDPRGRVGLLVDEWGAWHAVEPGTNPGFLYQQNTVRDALVAAVTLNIFNKHSDRVRMANIAQTVNVLQAVILTEGEKMLLTPTYHVFDLYQDHQGATLVGSYVEQESADDGAASPADGETNAALSGTIVPNLHESASVAEDGTLTITLANLAHEKAYDIDAVIVGHAARDVSAAILTGGMAAYNDFDAPERVAPADYTSEIRRAGEGLAFKIPPRSVLRLRL